MSNLNSEIKFHFLIPCTLNQRRELKVFMSSVFKKEKSDLHYLNVIFCTDRFLLSLNRKFLKHNYYTDILSFPLSEAGSPIEAEMYISVERVRENARAMKCSFKKELHRVIFHGVLHLCGYGDKSGFEAQEMRKKEDFYLSKYLPIR